MGNWMSKRHRRGRAAAHGEAEDPLEASARLIARARSITVFTGAGISVESGIPDFRSEGGLWQRFDPAVYCDYDVFRDRPEMFWTMVTSLYGDVHARLGGTREELRRGELRKPKPNAGHRALAELEAGLGKRVTVVTQNIDGLHGTEGGAGSTRVIELHGTEATCTCVKCQAVVPRDEVMRLMVAHDSFASSSSCYVPRHEGCGGVLKADVVLFGEPLPVGAMAAAAKAVMASSVVLVVGTSLEVAPANMIPSMVKYRPFGKLIINNLDGSGKDRADIFLQGNSSEVLPALVRRVRELSQRQ